jgi:REP element-mobilizing transposase RayT
MILSRSGLIVQIVWKSLPRYFPVRLDEWIVMPNHLHGIILIDNMGAPPGSPVNADGMGRGEADGSGAD